MMGPQFWVGFLKEIGGRKILSFEGKACKIVRNVIWFTVFFFFLKLTNGKKTDGDQQTNITVPEEAETKFTLNSK